MLALEAEGYTVDLYVFSHGTPGRFLVSRGAYGENAWVTGATIEDNVVQPNLRAVWQCNCYGSTLNAMWRRLGAQASMGTRFVNFYPTRFRGFASAWAGGETFGDAIAASDTALARTPSQAYMLIDASTRLQEWGGTIFQAPTVLGKNAAAEDYFRTCWLGLNYQVDKSGKQNMNFASGMLLDGSRTITR